MRKHLLVPNGKQPSTAHQGFCIAQVIHLLWRISPRMMAHHKRPSYFVPLPQPFRTGIWKTKMIKTASVSSGGYILLPSHAMLCRDHERPRRTASSLALDSQFSHFEPASVRASSQPPTCSDGGQPDVIKAPDEWLIRRTFQHVHAWCEKSIWWEGIKRAWDVQGSTVVAHIGLVGPRIIVL